MLATTTLKEVENLKPILDDDWDDLLLKLGKKRADSETLTLKTILDCIGIDCAVICLRASDASKESLEKFIKWCAQQAKNNAKSNPTKMAKWCAASAKASTKKAIHIRTFEILTRIAWSVQSEAITSVGTDEQARTEIRKAQAEQFIKLFCIPRQRV